MLIDIVCLVVGAILLSVSRGRFSGRLRTGGVIATQVPAGRGFRQRAGSGIDFRRDPRRRAAAAAQKTPAAAGARRAPASAPAACRGTPATRTFFPAAAAASTIYATSPATAD